MFARLLFTLALLFPLFATADAQVGVNTNSPEQALDVAGKVKIGDDATAPTNGTMRYNSPEGSFEGYSDGEWQALNKSAQPDTPIPFSASVYTTLQSEGHISMEFFRTYGPNRVFMEPNGEPTFIRTVVPAGYTMVVDYIHVVGMSTSANERFQVEISSTRGSAKNSDDLQGNRREPLIYVSGSVDAGPSVLGNGRAPILIVNANDQITVSNESNAASTGGVRVFFTGFLVSDLDQYFTY